MSTQINVTVDSGGLSDKARQLQTAARQAQLEKERTINLSAEALDKRVAAQAAKGLSPDGLPLYGTSFKQTEIERRPAANRSDAAPAFLFVPTQGYGADGILGQTKNIKNKLFVDTVIENSTVDKSEPAVFAAFGGPAGSSALLSRPAAVGEFPYSFLYFLACSNAEVKAINFNFYYTPPPRLLFVNDPPEEIIPGRYPLNKIKSYTVECYLRAAAGGPTNPAEGSVAGSSGASIRLHPNTGSLFSVELGYNDITTTFYLDADTFGDFSFDGFDMPYQLDFGSWYHVAQVGINGSIYLYFNGVLLKEIDSNSAQNFALLSNDAVMLAQVYVFNGGVRSLIPGIHGLRFTPKALYTGPFTPPASITSLA